MPVSNSKPFTLMLEPVKGCNIRCRYCYSDTEAETTMDYDVVSQAIEKTADYVLQGDFDELHIIWHGGEPLLAGLKFFRHATRLVQKMEPDIHATNYIQTNGLLLTDEYCRFFLDNNFELGVSFDGPSDLHDRFRVTHHGSGTHALVLDKLGLLEKHGIPFGFCAVASKAGQGNEEDLYRFFHKLGYGFSINPIIPGYDRRNVGKFLFDEGEYGTFLSNLFDIWISTEAKRIRVTPLDLYTRAVICGEIVFCYQEPSCAGKHMGIKPDGTAVLCSRFENCTLGNILKDALSDIFSSSFCRQVIDRKESLTRCVRCTHWNICHGGCPQNAMAFGRRLNEKDTFCKDYRIIFDHIQQSFREYEKRT